MCLTCASGAPLLCPCLLLQMVKDTNRVEDNAICFAGQVVLDNNKATTTHKLLGTMLKQEVANCFTTLPKMCKKTRNT